jgi:hypothetical protein
MQHERRVVESCGREGNEGHLFDQGGHGPGAQAREGALVPKRQLGESAAKPRYFLGRRRGDLAWRATG